MSRGEAGSGGRSASVPLGARIVIAFALAGLIAGFLWGNADVPQYSATAGVVVPPPEEGEEVDRAELARVAARGQSERVATTAAALLGGDVAGGDLLSDVSIAPAPRSGGVLVSATADSPDIAAATADGYAEALVEEGGDRLELGAAATVPTEPSEDRSASRSSAIGLAVGLLAGSLLALLTRRRGRSEARDERRRDEGAAPTAPPAPAGDDLAAAFGAPVVSPRVAPAGLIARSPGGRLSLEPESAADVELLVDELEIDAGSAPRRLAVLGTAGADGAAEVAAALGVAASQLGLTVIVVDADVYAPALAAATGVEAAPGLADYLEGDAGPRDVLRAASLGGGRSLVVLPAGERRSRSAEAIDASRLAGLLERLPRVYDLVVVAAPAAGEEGGAEVARRTDGAVVVAAEAPGAARRVGQAVSELGDAPVLAGVITAPSGAQARTQAALPKV